MREHAHHWSSGAGPVCLVCGLDYDDYVTLLEAEVQRLRLEHAAYVKLAAGTVTPSAVAE